MGISLKRTKKKMAGVATISSTQELCVVAPVDEVCAGFVQISTESDAGMVTGNRKVIPLECSDDYRLRVGVDNVLFSYSFESSTFPNTLFAQSSTILALTPSRGLLKINSIPITTASTSGHMTSRRTFPIYGTYSLYGDFWISESEVNATGAISEWGFGFVSGTNAPTDGVFFRRQDGGVLNGVVNNNGSETIVVLDTNNIPSRDGIEKYAPSDVNHSLIVIFNDVVNFWINDVLVGSIPCIDSKPTNTSSSVQPIFARVYSTIAGMSTPRCLSIGFLNVSQGDLNSNRPWGHAMCGNGGGAYQTQTGVAAAQTANYANSAIPATTVLSNTLAPASSTGRLSGLYNWAATAANEVDWIMFAYSPAIASNIIANKTLIVTRIDINRMFISGASSVNPTMFFWGVGVGGSADSLATADAIGAVSAKRIPLGVHSFTANSPIMTSSREFSVNFSSSPLIVPPGHRLHIFVKQLNGAATASLRWNGSVMVNGYFE